MLAILVRFIIAAIIGISIGICIRAKEDAKAWNMDFFAVLNDKLMRFFGRW